MSRPRCQLHDDWRITPAGHGRCRECQRQGYRRWRSANPEKARANSNRWKAANPERTKAAIRDWQQANPDKVAEHDARRHARQRHNGVFLVTRGDKRRLMARFDGRCAYCGSRPATVFDHIIPIKRGGRHSVGNLLPACTRCNTSKRDILLADWLRRRTPAQEQTR